MAMTKAALLAGDIRRAIDEWAGDQVGGDWDDIIDIIARVVDSGSLDLETAAQLNHHLRRTGWGLLRDDEPQD